MRRSGSPHVGYIVQQFLPEVGAGPARVGEMADRWTEAGAAVTVITAMPNRPQGRIQAEYRGKLFLREPLGGYQVLRSWIYASPKYGFARTLLNGVSFMATSALHTFFRARDIDVLVASSPPFFLHIGGVAVARMRGIPLVLEIRDLWPDYLVGMGVVKSRHAARALFALERYLLSKADRVVVVTEAFRDRVVEKGVPRSRIEVISNGVDTSFYYRSAEEPPLPSLRRRGDEFIVGYLGNFGAGQDVASLVDAAALLAAEDPTVRVVLAGDGSDRARVVARAGDSRLPNVSLESPIPKHDTRAFYNSCDACLVPLAGFPILQETVPSKIFEIMACERPIVACLGGEGARIIERSGGGIVAAPGDPRSIADAILRMKRLSAAERAAMGERGRRFVAEHYARDVLATRFLALLRDVARGNQGGRGECADADDTRR